MELTNRVMKNSQPYSFLFYNRHNSLGAIDLGTEILIALPKKKSEKQKFYLAVSYLLLANRGGGN